jgi:TolA-binding protein
MRFVVTPVIMAALLLAVPCLSQVGLAQVESREGITLQNQIYQLRQELKSIEDQMGRGGGTGNRAPVYAAPPQQQYGNDLLAQLLTRVDALEDQVRQLRGRLDETQNQLQRQNDDLGKRIGDLGFQVNSQGGQPSGPPPVGQGQGPRPLPPPPPAQRPAPPQGPATSQGATSQGATSQGATTSQGPRTPEVALQEANAALARRDYPAAETAAREVLANRTSPRAYDAQLVLAQSLSGQRQYAQAAIAFDDAYNRSRKGSHAQDALLGLASSLTAINEKKAACDTLTRLRNDFPQPRPDIRDGAAATAQKAGCR